MKTTKQTCKSLQALPLQAYIKQLNPNIKRHHSKNNRPATEIKHDRIIIIVSL